MINALPRHGSHAHPDAKRARGSPTRNMGTAELEKMSPRERSNFSYEKRGGVLGWQEGKNNWGHGWVLGGCSWWLVVYAVQ